MPGINEKANTRILDIHTQNQHKIIVDGSI